MKKDYLPNKNNTHNFIFNLLLLMVTLLLGNFYIGNKLAMLNQEKVEQQNLINKREEFIKNFAEIGQRRIYLAEVYYKNFKAKENTIITDESWYNYMESVRDWNYKNLLNPIFIGYYFGQENKEYFYQDLQIKFVRLHESLIKLRDGEGDLYLDQEIEGAKHTLYIFTENIMAVK